MVLVSARREHDDVLLHHCLLAPDQGVAAVLTRLRNVRDGPHWDLAALPDHVLPVQRVANRTVSLPK